MMIYGRSEDYFLDYLISLHSCFGFVVIPCILHYHYITYVIHLPTHLWIILFQVMGNKTFGVMLR